MTEQKTEQKPDMKDHEKRIWEAAASGENFSGNDIHALLADLDAMRGVLKSVQAAIYMDDAGQLRLTRGFDESTIDAALQSAQPAVAAVSDEEITRIVWEYTRLNPNQAADTGLVLCIRNAVRAILALRPQAAPMTDWALDVDSIGITQRADGGEG